MAALPRSLAVRLTLAGLVVAVVLSVIGLISTSRHETRAAKESREFREFLGRMSSPISSVAALAVAGIPDQKKLLTDSDRLAEMAALFSGDRLRGAASAERLDVARAFWHEVLALGDPVGLKLLPEELARLRHACILTSAREEDPEELDRLAEGDGGPRIRAGLRGLIDELFRSPSPPREQLGALLWDRANLEEMAGLPEEALASWRLLEYDRVRSHWELDSRPNYMIRKADLLGRILRKMEVQAQGKDRPPESAPSFKSDTELTAFRAEEGGAAAWLLDGLELLHRGEHLSAAAAFGRYLRGDSKEEKGYPPIDTRLKQLAVLLRAEARRSAAEAAFRAAEGIGASPPRLGALARGGLEMKRARLIASLGWREEFEALRPDLARGSHENASLLAAVSEVLWGEKDRGAAELKKVVAGRADFPEGAEWMEVARGASAPAPRTLFEVGQLSDELGDLPRLDRTISRLSTSIETGADEAYLAFLRAVLRLRKGQVVEAWGDLERLLDRPEFPAGLDRRTIARFMEGAEDAADLLSRARSLTQEAEKDLTFLRDRGREIDPALALLASAELWKSLLEGEAIEVDRAASRRDLSADLLAVLRPEIDAADPPTHVLDRTWIDLRNCMGRSYRSLGRAGQVDAALGRLADLSLLLGKGFQGRLLGEEANLRRDRAALRESTGDQQGALTDFCRAGELYLAAAEASSAEGRAVESEAQPSAIDRAEAANAFERCGDPQGVVRALLPIGRSSRDPALLMRLGKALLAGGELEKAREIFWRALTLGEEVVLVVEEPGDPVHLGGHYFRDPPPDLTSWLDLTTYVDPVNGTGIGRLRYDAVRRTLEWRAPKETRFGRPVYVPEGELSRLPSGDDPGKTILVAPRRGINSQVLPRQSGEWDLQVLYREASVDPVQLEGRLLLGEAALRLARLPRFEGPDTAKPFIEHHLGGRGSTRVRSALHLLLEKSLEELWRDPHSQAALSGELNRAISSWRTWLAEEKAGAGESGRARLEWLRGLEKDLTALSAAAGDPARLKAMLDRDIPQMHERLRGFYGAGIHLLLTKEGAGGPVRATLEELGRDLLDQEAREELLFLCENVGNRSLLWKRAMALRAIQVESRAAEAKRTAGDQAVLGPRPDPAVLTEEIRDIYDRLLRVSDLKDGPAWIGRAILSLSRIEAKAGRIKDARAWLDRLADADMERLGRRLLPADRADLEALSRTAAFSRADLARRGGDLPEAIRLYSDVLQRHGASPLALWAHLELGGCYEAQGLPEEAYREYQKGKFLLAGELGSPATLEHWFEGDRGKVIESIRQMYPGGEADGAIASLGKGATGSDRAFWDRLFDERLKALPRQ